MIDDDLTEADRIMQASEEIALEWEQFKQMRIYALLMDMPAEREDVLINQLVVGSDDDAALREEIQHLRRYREWVMNIEQIAAGTSGDYEPLTE